METKSDRYKIFTPTGFGFHFLSERFSATLNAREGRVMIYNLVEAAQEFLSGIEPIAKSNESKLLQSTMESNEELFPKDMASLNKKSSFVYGFIDLFSGCGEAWSWGFGMDETARKSSSLTSSKLDVSKPHPESREKKSDSKETPLIMQELPAKLDTVGEVSEDSNNSLSLTPSRVSLGEGTGATMSDDEVHTRKFFHFLSENLSSKK